MDVTRVEKIVDGYVGWWRRGVEIYPAGEGARIVCPLLDRHNDHMSLYIAEDPDGHGYLLTDMGAILGDLATSGCDVLSSDSRTRKLDSVAAGFGLSREGTELCCRADEGDLFQSMSFLMQGMATVDDLFFTSSDQTRNFFLDDLSEWFWEKSVPVVPDVRIVGKSGFETRFDFVIPKSRKADERLVKAVANPSRSSVENALFGFGDIEEARPSSKWLVIMNLTKSDKTSNRIMGLEDACKHYGAQPVRWDGNADKYMDLLAA